MIAQNSRVAGVLAGRLLGTAVMYQAVFQDDCSSLDGISDHLVGQLRNFNHWQERQRLVHIFSGAFRARNSSADPGDLPETYPQSTVTLDSGEIDLSTFGSWRCHRHVATI
jgi:hypothetical protein